MPAPKRASANSISDLLTSFHLPHFSVDHMASVNRRNFEAATATIQLALESWQTVFHRQINVITQSAAEGTIGLRELLSPGAPEEKLAQQADFFKSTFEKGLSNLREVSEILVESSTEATDVLAKSVTESLAEFKGTLTKAEPKQARA
jgi:phasin family protein